MMKRFSKVPFRFSRSSMTVRPLYSALIYLMIEHGPREEEGEVEVDVILREELLHGGQAPRVVVHGEVGREEGAELHEGVLALKRRNEGKAFRIFRR